MIAATTFLCDDRERTPVNPRSMHQDLAIRTARRRAPGIRVPASRPPFAHHAPCSPGSSMPTTACWCEGAWPTRSLHDHARSIRARRRTSAWCGSRCQVALASRMGKSESEPRRRAAIVAPSTQAQCCAAEWISFGQSSLAPRPAGVVEEQCGTSHCQSLGDQPNAPQVRA
jgi:hypothetical protein